MTVASILKTKGNRVITVAPTDDLAGAVAVLIREGVGAALVRSADGRVVGVVSERDIVRGLAKHGKELLAMPVERLMTRDVVFCAPGDAIHDVMQLMTERRFRHLPVLDNGRLVGLVSIGDVVKWRIAEAELEAESLRSYIATG
jgi:CBS domain-containing protein